MTAYCWANFISYLLHIIADDGLLSSKLESLCKASVLAIQAKE